MPRVHLDSATKVRAAAAAAEVDVEDTAERRARAPIPKVVVVMDVAVVDVTAVIAKAKGNLGLILKGGEATVAGEVEDITMGHMGLMVVHPATMVLMDTTVVEALVDVDVAGEVLGAGEGVSVPSAARHGTR